MRRGIALFAATPSAVVADTARLAEELGYASVWLNHPGSSDGIGALAAASASTRLVDLGVGVVPLHLRSPESIVAAAQEASLPSPRLVLGIGTNGPGAWQRARDGIAEIRKELGCRTAMAALSEGACRVAGEVADGVLFNWVTPDYARRSATWVADGAAKAGRPTPRLYAYVRVALGADAQTRIEAEGARYTGVTSYARHFERMGEAPLETAIAASSPDEVTTALEAWEGAVDEPLLRFLPTSDSVGSHLELVRAGAPT
jgi:alkanesulfonate monooxygenase SsuD/methylene tetrahydromethanopterin reductase-like flavin-dependent oxidoreductase (luciferase family)